MLTYSLIFGLLAWVLAAIAVWLRGNRGSLVLVFGSFLCASVSAVWQFFEIQKRAYVGDYAGIEDTIRAVIIGVVVMLAVTLVLDFVALCGRKR